MKTDMKMHEYIMEIINFEPLVRMSWGFSNPTAVEKGLRFSVQGFLHKGFVEVTYCDGPDLFEVRILNQDLTLKETVEDVYLDQLVDVIDSRVECEAGSNYGEKVFQHYGIEA